ncbi:MAG: hypothetical protein ACLT4A_10560 [Anaerobutyricum soehngenii]
MSKTGKVELSNYQILNIVSWYNKDFKSSDRSKEFPMKQRLNLQRNISTLIGNAQSFEKICKQLVINVQKEYFTEEKTIEKKRFKRMKTVKKKKFLSIF